MHGSWCCSGFSVLLLLGFSTITPVPFAQQTPPTSKAPIVAPTTTGKQRTGDLDTLLQHRVVRIGVPYSRTFYYVIKGVQYGTAYEMGKAFEQYLNKKYPHQNKNIRTHVFFIVTARDQAITKLNDGWLDIVAGGITITPERQKFVDFSDPVFRNVNEIVVTGPSSPQLASLDDLSGKEVFGRKTSAYWEHLQRLNERFQKERKPAVILRAVPDDLADDDILQMVNAGLLSTTVVNDWTAKLWNKLLPKLQLRTDIAIARGESTGWAVRKNSPKLLGTINEFLKTHSEGSAFGNQVITKYTGSTYMLKQAVSPESMKRFEETADIFRKYSNTYGMDYLLMMAQGYQESSLNQQAKSRVGAVGIMQVMPQTGAEMKVGDIHQVDPNIHAGVKYFHNMLDTLYGNEPMDDLNKVLFTFAVYNCGSGRVKQLRAEAAQKGLNPNVWIDNVEFIAANRVGVETVNYVSNIYKYYVSYKLIAVQEEQRRKAERALKEKPQ
jgi:membrane-bound lytic murein transglycosylase MltF